MEASKQWEADEEGREGGRKLEYNFAIIFMWNVSTGVWCEWHIPIVTSV